MPPPNLRSTPLNTKSVCHWVYVFVAGIVLLLLIAVPDLIGIHQDVAALMNHAGFIQEEPDFGAHIAGVNIPFEQWFYGFPNKLSHVVTLSPNKVIMLVAIAICLLSFILASRLIRQPEISRSNLEATLWAIAVVAILFLLPLAGKNLFAIREHIMIALILPYILTAYARLEGYQPPHFFTVMVGISAAIGFCAKPLYGPVFVSVELFTVVHNHKFRALFRVESILAATIGLVYLIVWLTLYGDYFQRAPHLLDGLQGFLLPTAKVAKQALLSLAPVGLVLLSIYSSPRIRNSRASSLNTRCIYFTIIVILMVMVAVIQRRWYWHHLYPIYSSVFLFLAATYRYQRPLIPILTCGYMLAILIPYYRVAFYVHPQTLQAKKLLGPIIAKQTVGVISPHPAPYMQVISQFNAKWRFPFHNMAYLATEYKKLDAPNIEPRYLTLDEMTESSRYAQRLVVDLLKKAPPRYMIVDRQWRYPFTNLKLEYLEALKQDPSFRFEWLKYRKVPSVAIESGRFEVYELIPENER